MLTSPETTNPEKRPARIRYNISASQRFTRLILWHARGKPCERPKTPASAKKPTYDEYNTAYCSWYVTSFDRRSPL